MSGASESVGRQLALPPVSEMIVKGFEELHAAIPQLEPEELLAMYHQAAYLGKQAWLVQAHILWEAKGRKAHHNDGGVRAVAEDFGISPSNASGLIRTWEAYGEDFLSRRAPFDHMIGVSWYKTAAYTDDPQGWLEYAAARKKERPDYSIRDLRSDIEAGKIGSGEGRPPSPAAPSATAAHQRQLPAPTPLRQPPAPAPAPARDDLVDRYLATVEVLSAALDDTDALIFHTDPAELAALLPPPSEDDLLDQRLLARAFDFLRAVFSAREARGRGRDRAAARPASA